MRKLKKKIQEPMMKRVNKPFHEFVQRLVKTDPKEVKKLMDRDNSKKQPE
jgi:hypothetical protein